MPDFELLVNRYDRRRSFVCHVDAHSVSRMYRFESNAMARLVESQCIKVEWIMALDDCVYCSCKYLRCEASFRTSCLLRYQEALLDTNESNRTNVSATNDCR
jgi:tRNA A37 threonylcarbamoyladenosine biosynthesis protein TsaE